MVRPRKTDKPAREKILETAADLFYRQGYHQTGINQLIDEAGVSKATFYAHFPTKESLSLAELNARICSDFTELMSAVENASAPFDRYMALVRIIEPFMLETDYRGCAFANMAVEITDPTNPIVEIVREHDRMYLDLIRKVTRELIASDPPRYAHLDPDEIAEQYYLLIEGAIAAAHNLREIWPVRRAVALAEKLVQ